MPSSAPTRFRERSELLDFLLEVAGNTSESVTDFEGLLANVAEIVQKVIPYELFAILLYNEKHRELRIRHAIGHRQEIVDKLRIRLGEGLTGTAAETQKAVLCGDVRTDPRYLNTVDAVRAELAVPMLARRKLVGVIDVQSTRPDAYSHDDRVLLQLIAGRVAATIDTARLYRLVERQSRTQKLLLRLAEEFSSILDLDELLRQIADAIKVLIRYDAFSVLLVDDAARCLRHRFSIRYDERVKLDNIPLGKGITGAAASTRDVVRSDNTLADPRYIPSHAGVRSEVAVPLITRGRVIGVMDVESDRFAYFTDEHTRMLALLAPQIANSVENARLYEEVGLREKRIEKDLEAAHELQLAMLPKLAPDLEGLDAAIGYRPARILGGDLYDFYDYGAGSELIAFGDVSGKGVSAALYGALILGLLRTQAPLRHRPAELLRILNDTLEDRKVDARYVSLVAALWDPRTRQFTVANAGALPPVVCRDRQILRPRVEGIPLGLLKNRDYEQVHLQAQAGDVVVLYSDGITDQVNEAGEEYGRTRLLHLLRSVCTASPREIVDAVFAGLACFSGTAPAFDDQTLVILKVKP